MHWLKSDKWKAGIGIVGMLLLLIFMVWVPVSAAGAYEGASRLTTPVTGMVQVMPTEDAAVSASSKEQLTLQVKQLQNQPQNQNNWLINNSTALIAAFASVVVALFGIYQWAGNVRQAKDKDLKAQAEERFKSAVTALGDEKEGTQIGGAILLRSFLNKDDKKSYERYYPQVFDLAVAYLRLPRTPTPPEDLNAAQSLTALSQALIVVFKESFPRARNQHQRGPRTLDATGIQLDNAYLVEADLTEVWMPCASLRKANLSGANLRGAFLNQAKLSGADLIRVDLSNARLREANLSGANLRGAKLIDAKLSGADLSGAHLSPVLPENALPLSGTRHSSSQSTEIPFTGAKLIAADLSGAKLSRADLSSADLSRAKLIAADLSSAYLIAANLSSAYLSKADLSGAYLLKADLSQANLSGADLSGTNLHGVSLRGASLSEVDFSQANLSFADLSQANVTEEQLNQAKALEGAIMPDGTVHP